MSCLMNCNVILLICQHGKPVSKLKQSFDSILQALEDKKQNMPWQYEIFLPLYRVCMVQSPID